MVPRTAVAVPENGPYLPDHVVQFLNALPTVGDMTAWMELFREGLRTFLGDIDRVAVRVNPNCPLEWPEDYNPSSRITQLVLDPIKASETVMMTTQLNDLAPSASLLLDLASNGHQLDEYHAPLCYDYYFAGKAYLGSVLLFRERGKSPISERTRNVMASLEPFMVFVLSDLVTRHFFARPVDRLFMEILSQVADEGNLSSQDTRILSLMLLGLSYKQVADRMDLSIDTIRKHTKRIYRKTRTGSLPELFAKYFSPRFGIEGLGEDDSL